MGKKKKNKERGLFDHLNMIKKGKDPDYWETLSDSEKKSFSTFMIERFLSMNPEFTPIISQIKPFTYHMEDRHVYRLYADLLPYDPKYWEYISNKNKERYPKWIVERLANHFEVAYDEVRNYIDIYLSMENGKEEIKKILRMYGMEDDKIKEVDKL